jgi:hypothetical protein
MDNVYVDRRRRHDSGDPAVKVSITIRRSQKEWVDETCLNLSRAVQDMLNQMMKKVKYV